MRINAKEVADHQNATINAANQYQTNPLHKAPITTHNPDEERKREDGIPLMNAKRTSAKY